MSGPSILVLGADSFAGSRIVASLAKTGSASVVALPAATPGGVLRGALPGASTVVNATMGSPRTIAAAARALYAALGESDVRRVVQLSSMTVYGRQDGDFNEDSELPPILEPYPAAQREAELRALRLPNALVLRPGCEYGPGCPQWSARVADWLKARRLGDLGAAGDGLCNLIYIDDLVQAVIAALRRGSGGSRIFNLAMSGPPTWNEYLVGFALQLGAVPVRRVTRRRWSVETRLLAPPLKVAELMAAAVGLRQLRIPPAIPPSFQSLCAQEIRLDVRRAEQQLGMTWMPLDRGLAAAAAAYRGPAV